METMFGRYGSLSLLLIATTAGLTSGCASKNYVRTQVGASATEMSARMDEQDRNLQNGIDANSNQITELSGVAREHTQQISSLDSGLKSTDGKATQAMSLGQGAQTTANQAVGQVNRLDMAFQNRNNYSTVHEQSVLFGFGSAQVDDESISILEDISTRAKSMPNAILVLEGRTDSTGDPIYNIQLGEKRLDAVVRNLVVEQGVPIQQIYKMSFGEARPVASNETREGRAQNRAVVLRLMEPNPSGGPGSSYVSDATPRSQ